MSRDTQCAENAAADTAAAAVYDVCEVKCMFVVRGWIYSTSICVLCCSSFCLRIQTFNFYFFTSNSIRTRLVPTGHMGFPWELE